MGRDSSFPINELYSFNDSRGDSEKNLLRDLFGRGRARRLNSTGIIVRQDAPGMFPCPDNYATIEN
jgi:hypothetical protein